MVYRQNLSIAQKMIFQELSDHIISDYLDGIRPELTIKFIQNFTLYIRYNRIGEYSYHIQLGSADLNRVRYDNMDLDWEVTSKPNHFHIRYRDDIVTQSDMTGDVGNDMPKLIDYIKENLL